MRPSDEFEIKRNKFIRQSLERGGLFFTKHYLLLEVERLKISLQHFFEAGSISKDDYEYLVITLKMIEKFLSVHLRLQQLKSERHKKFHKNYYPNQASLFDKRNPLPITGKIEVSGLTESLSALKPKEIEKTGPRFPYKIPARTHWNQVIIKFLDNEHIEIHVKKLKHITGYKEMGMIGKGNVPTPSEQWIFLKVLSQCQGEISIKDPQAKDTYKKHKQALAETLQQYFSIDYDPFYPYKSSPEKSENSYKIKITLIPVSIVAKPNSYPDIEEDTLGIQEYLDEEAPQVIDD